MPEAHSKLCKLSQMMRCIENPGIVGTIYSSIFQGCLGIFRGIDAYLVTLAGAQLEGGRPPLPLTEKQKSVLILENKVLIVFIFGFNFPFKM